MSEQPKPNKILEFQITNECNYNCSYCSQGLSRQKINTNSHANDKVIDSFIVLLERLSQSWTVGLVGGEATIHPRFFEVCEQIKKNKHKLHLVTNFSLPIKKFKKLVDITGDALSFLGVSLHLECIKSINSFIEKVVELNAYKNINTSLRPLSVLTEQNIDILIKIKQALLDSGIALNFQVHKTIENNIFKYSEESLIKMKENKIIINPHGILTKKTFGTICHTGYQGFVINNKGDVKRCYQNQSLFNLGNIIDEKYCLYSRPLPCLADTCNCLLFPHNNMIRHGEEDIFLATELVSLSNMKEKITEQIYSLTGLDIK